METSNLVKNTYPAHLVRIVCIRGKGYILRLMTLLSSRKSDTHRTLPSFFGIIKVGDAHLEAPHFCRTPISHNRCNSVLKPSK